MNTFKKLCVSAILVCGSFSANAQYAAIVIDADTGNVLHQVSATHRWFPASLTKVMTLYMTFAALKSGQLSMYDMAPVSAYAASQPTSKLGLHAGETISIQDAILAIISRSANDAAVVLAERIGGSEAQFARQMTAMARSLNMTSSSFYNATGLPNPRQVSSPRDLAILASRIRQDFKAYFPLFSTTSFYFKGRNLPNINNFLKTYAGAEGMKTGFTCGSGFNLIAAAQRDGKHLIGVLMGAMTRGERNDVMTSIMDQGFYSANQGDYLTNISSLNQIDYSSPPFQLSPTTCHYEDYSITAKRSSDGQKVSNYAAARPITTLPVYKSTTPVTQRPTVAESEESVTTIKNWTVVLGAFSDRNEAEEFNQDVRAKLQELSRIGYPVVMQHETDGVNLWHALWTGLNGMTQASQVCKYLWESDIECSILPAEVLASRDAPWR